MKKKVITKIFISILAVVIVLAFLAPYLLQLERVRLGLNQDLTQRLDSRVEIRAISWQWFPIPCIRLRNAHISNDRLEADLPEAMLFPDWLGLFRGKLGIGHVAFRHPFVHIKSLKIAQRHRILPSTTLVIEDGNLLLDLGGALPWLHSRRLKFSDVRGKIEIGPDEIGVSLACVPPYAKGLKVKGHFSPSKHSYKLAIDSKGLKLHKIIAGLLKEYPITPVDSDLNIGAVVTGTGLKKITASIKGRSSYLKIRSHGKEISFSCDHADLGLKKQGGQLMVSVNTLGLTDPRLTMSGIVERHGLSDKGIWHIDLKGKDIDLSGIRDRVLALFGGNEVADLVCGIVLGGRARGARYLFNGDVSAFQNLKSMIITADVDGAPIHVPGADLDLKDACGKIRIRDGILTGQNLSARLDDSVGKNGSLELGLVGKDRVFKLDLGLDADLSKLPPLLHRLIHNQGFRDELGKFSKVKGIASGNLILGDRLDNIAVRVEVSDINGDAYYQRISWPIHIKGGQLQIFPQGVEWKDIQGTVGPNVVHDTDGLVRWEDDTVYLEVKRLDASLDSGPVYAKLEGYPGIKKVLSKVLLSVNGPLELRNSWLKGPAGDPLKWRYGIDVHAKGLDFHSPLLPGTSHVREASVQVNQEKVLISRCNMRLSDQDISLRGNLRHRDWQDWKGWLEMSGTVRQGISRWVKTKGWIPDLYFPRVPCRLDHLRVAWDRDTVDVKGRITSEKRHGKASEVRLDLSSRPKGFFLRDLTIASRNERASFSLQVIPGKRLALNWNGYLDRDGLDGVLEKNRLLSGYIDGSCNLSLGDRGPGHCKGLIEASGLNWYWGLKKPLEIRHAYLKGRRSRVDIKDLYVGMDGESIHSTGQVLFSRHNVDLDLALRSKFLSWEKLSGLLKSYKKGPPSQVNRPESTKPSSPLSVTGRIGFNLGKFGYSHYTWHSIAGQIRLLSQDKTSVSISSGTICDINTTGNWRSWPAHGIATIFISSSPSKKPALQEVLPCLGLEKGLMEGSFTINAMLRGMPGNWQGGKVKFQSVNGKIERMTLLSKIFSILNVMDLFSKNGISDVLKSGLFYSRAELDGVVRDNNLVINKAIVKGKGLNFFASGRVNMAKADLDINMLVSPFKTIDTVVSKVPILGRVIGGKDASIIAIPVKIKGQIKDPKVTVLPPDAVGKAMIDLVLDTVKLPFRILSPILP